MENENRTAQAERAPADDGKCIGCGPDHPFGLRLSFSRVSADAVATKTILSEAFAGWAGFAHGGTVCMLLDEAMAWACANVGRSCVTANLNVRFRRPTPLDETITITGAVVERRGRVFRLHAELRDSADRILASADGDFVDRGPLDSASIIGRLQLQETS